MKLVVKLDTEKIY